MQPHHYTWFMGSASGHPTALSLGQKHRPPLLALVCRACTIAESIITELLYQNSPCALVCPCVPLCVSCTPRLSAAGQLLSHDGDGLPELFTVRLMHCIGKLQREGVAAARQGHICHYLCLAKVQVSGIEGDRHASIVCLWCVDE